TGIKTCALPIYLPEPAGDDDMGVDIVLRAADCFDVRRAGGNACGGLVDFPRPGLRKPGLIGSGCPVAISPRLPQRPAGRSYPRVWCDIRDRTSLGFPPQEGQR